MAVDLKIKTTGKICCHWCALGVSPERKKVLISQIRYISDQIKVFTDSDILPILEKMSNECQTPEELAAVAWTLGVFVRTVQESIAIEKKNKKDQIHSALEPVPIFFSGSEMGQA